MCMLLSLILGGSSDSDSDKKNRDNALDDFLDDCEFFDKHR